MLKQMISRNQRPMIVFSVGNFSVFIVIFKMLYFSSPQDVIVYDSALSCVFVGVSLYGILVELSQCRYDYVLYALLSSLFFVPFLLFVYIEVLSIKDIVVYGFYGCVITVPLLLIARWRTFCFTIENKSKSKEVVRALLFSTILVIVYVTIKKLVGYNIITSMLLVFYSLVLPFTYAAKCVLCGILRIFNNN